MRASPDKAATIVVAVKIVLTSILWFVLLAPVLAVQQAPPGQSEYVPIKDLPPTEQMPAAPLLIAAYAFAWVAVMFYLWTIWRRLNKVETEMHALAQKTARR
jgi:CcmD family protein